jgi:hypothetical protein
MRILVVAAAVFLSAALWSQTVPQGTKFLVKLSDSLSSKTSRKGDKVGAVVISPVALRGGRLEGAVEEAEGGRLRFSFHTLRFAGKTVPIRTEVTGVVSSKGNAGLDDLEQAVSVERGTVVVKAPAVAIDEGAEIRLAGEEK